MSFHVPNQFRFKKTGHLMASTDSFGNNGAFIVPCGTFELTCIASDGVGWEHVSVSLKNRTPNWKQMCFIKDLFWDETDWVVQFHPAKSEYVNNHENCLHLWRPTNQRFPTPHSLLVGIK